MRKLWSILFAIVGCIGTMFANGVEIDSLYYELNRTELAAVVTYRDAPGEPNLDITTAYIPDTVVYNDTSYVVTRIGQDAFNQCPNLSAVRLPSGLQAIDQWAFTHCTSLTSIEFPAGLKEIKAYSFMGSGITSIVLPESVERVESYAFFCYYLTSVTFPATTPELESDAFYSCTSLRTIYNYNVDETPIHKFVFREVDKTACTLYVVQKRKVKYQYAEGWKEFPNIVDSLKDELLLTIDEAQPYYDSLLLCRSTIAYTCLYTPLRGAKEVADDMTKNAASRRGATIYLRNALEQARAQVLEANTADFEAYRTVGVDSIGKMLEEEDCLAAQERIPAIQDSLRNLTYDNSISLPNNLARVDTVVAQTETNLFTWRVEEWTTHKYALADTIGMQMEEEDCEDLKSDLYGIPFMQNILRGESYNFQWTFKQNMSRVDELFASYMEGIPNYREHALERVQNAYLDSCNQLSEQYKESDTCLLLIQAARDSLENMVYDHELLYVENVARIKDFYAQLKSDLDEQIRKEEEARYQALLAEFEAYKQQKAADCAYWPKWNGVAQVSDSCQKIIEDAQAAILACEYDRAFDLEINENTVYSVYFQWYLLFQEQVRKEREEGIEVVIDEIALPRKTIRDGQVVIERGDKVFTVTGKEL
ncbi:MAG: leucine-rich repeat protein [Paludibacteraceae bacterium]|nr:leucine-rich repeat protein [Paludibacteraceae bacterium]